MAMTEAEKLFNGSFARWLYVSSLISNFRSTFTTIAPSASEHLEAKTAELFRSMFEDPLWAGMLVDSETGESATAKPSADYRKLGKIGAQVIFNSSYASLDAAVLIFYHSLLDALAFDCCRVTILHTPRDWEQDLKNTKVQLLDTRNKSYDQLLQAKLDECLVKLERESLLTKVDRLFARCNPPPGWSPMVGYTFDAARVKRLDDQRHKIIHGEALGKPLTVFEISEENLFYVNQTGLYFLGLLNFKYSLRVDPRYWPQAMQAMSGTKNVDL